MNNASRILAGAGLSLLLSAPAMAAGGSAEWGYSGKTGPENWGDLSEA